MSITLRFPAEHPVVDVLPSQALPPASAPKLMPNPPPPPPRPMPPPPELPRLVVGPPQGKKVAAIVGAVACAVIVTVALVATSRNEVPDARTTGDQGIDQAAPVLNPVPTDETSAQRLLENQVANDRAQVESLTDQWVPQLSSKKFGLVVNGTTYDYRAVWSDFTTMRERHPGALLLWSNDYSSFRLTDFWVTVAPDSHDSGEAANGWCASMGIGKDDCYAKRITHTGGYAENTLLRN